MRGEPPVYFASSALGVILQDCRTCPGNAVTTRHDSRIPACAPHPPVAVVAVPPFFDFYTTRHRLSALGAQTVAHICRSCGYTVSVRNFPAEKRRGAPIEIPPHLNHLAPHLIPNETGPLSWFTRYQRFGPEPAACADEIAAQRPLVCLLNCFAFCYSEPVRELARELKKRVDCTIIAGGGGVSCNPGWFMGCEAIDAAFVGEAECGLEHLLTSLRHQGRLPRSPVPNTWLRRRDTVLPPSRIERSSADMLLPIVVPTVTSTRSVSLSRGCPLRCSFCSNHVSHGSGFRGSLHPPVMAPGASRPEPGNRPVHLTIEDDNVLLDPGWFFDRLAHLHLLLGPFRFQFENGIDYRLLTPQLLQRLVHEGLTGLNISIATTNPLQARDSNRTTDLDHYETIVRCARQLRLPVITYFICGLGRDTVTSTAATLAWLAAQPTAIAISPFYPVPGLEGYDELSRFAPLHPALCAGSSCYPWNATLSTVQMITAFRLSRFINVLKREDTTGAYRELIRTCRRRTRLHTMVKTGQGEVRIADVPLQDRELVASVMDRLPGQLPQEQTGSGR